MMVIELVFFFKQKTAYEMRISDWSSDVCSSDLDAIRAALATARNNGAVGAVGECMARLSPRERQVLDLVVASKPNKIIADILGISIKTVELHRANMMNKLGVRSLPELMKVALGHA